MTILNYMMKGEEKVECATIHFHPKLLVLHLLLINNDIKGFERLDTVIIADNYESEVYSLPRVQVHTTSLYIVVSSIYNSYGLGEERTRLKERKSGSSKEFSKGFCHEAKQKKSMCCQSHRLKLKYINLHFPHAHCTQGRKKMSQTMYSHNVHRSFFVSRIYVRVDTGLLS